MASNKHFSRVSVTITGSAARSCEGVDYVSLGAILVQQVFVIPEAAERVVLLVRIGLAKGSVRYP